MKKSIVLLCLLGASIVEAKNIKITKKKPTVNIDKILESADDDKK